MIENLLFSNNELPTQKISKSVFEDLGFLDWSEAYSHTLYIELLECMGQMPSKDTILLRQRIFSDVLRWKELFVEWAESFEKVIERHQVYTSSKFNFNKSANFLLFAKEYIAYLEELDQWHTEHPLESEEFVAYLLKNKQFLESQACKTMKEEITEAYAALEKILSFSVGFQGKTIQVEPLDQKPSLEERLIELGTKLGLPLNGIRRHPSKSAINAQVIQASLKIHQEEYQLIKDFYHKHNSISFDYENMRFAFRFYLFFYSLVVRGKNANIPFTKSKINEEGEIIFRDVFDVVLLSETANIVPNDVHLTGNRSIQLITGVNSGGKTSYIRAIGVNLLLHLQIGHTFSREASVCVFPNLFTHFPQDENFRVGHGRLSDELRRLEQMKQQFQEKSILILNETFSSTDEDTARHHTQELLSYFVRNKIYVLFVTHQQKLFSEPLDESIVVMSPQIDRDNKNKRLYKVVETTDKAASYAYDILYQYKLTKEQLNRRLEKNNEG